MKHGNMNKLAIVHFMPLEYYPPVTNFLNFVGKKEILKTRVWTCHNIKSRKPFVKKNIKVSRTAFPDVKEPIVFRFCKYWVFNFNTLCGLIFCKPTILLYYESYSAWPVYIFLRFFNRKCKLFIHYHEYSSPDWYRKGMRLVKRYHKLEKKYLFHRASWISQTNKNRLDLFQKDNQYLEKTKFRILANYPPKDWYNKPNRNNENEFTKFIYVGSLSLKNTYIAEFCEWVKGQKGKATFDIFSYNLDNETLKYLNSLQSKWINFHSSGIEYYDLPSILKEFQIGLILYKANTINHKYNETNKLFEYTACGLDVWFPDVMEGTLPHICRDARPRVVDINFEKLNSYILLELYNTSSFSSKKNNFTCEAEFDKIYKEIVSEG